MVEVNEGHRRFPWARWSHRRDRLVHVARALDVDLRPARRHGHAGCDDHLGRDRASTAGRLLPALSEAARTVGYPADPPHRHGRGQPGHLLTGRRRAAACAPHWSASSTSSGRWSTLAAGGGVHGRRQAHCARTRRDDRVDHPAACSTVGRATARSASQHDGDRHRQRLRRDRCLSQVGAHRARLGRSHHHSLPTKPRRTRSIRSTGGVAVTPSRPTLRWVGCGVEPPDRRSPLDRRLPSPHRRRSWRLGSCDGHFRVADS